MTCSFSDIGDISCEGRRNANVRPRVLRAACQRRACFAVARLKSGQHPPQDHGRRRALGSMSGNTAESVSRKQQLVAYQEKKRQQSRGSKSKVSAQSKIHAHMKPKKTLVVAGGITRKDRYSDIYGHRQKLAAKQMR